MFGHFRLWRNDLPLRRRSLFLLALGNFPSGIHGPGRGQGSFPCVRLGHFPSEYIPVAVKGEEGGPFSFLLGPFSFIGKKYCPGAGRGPFYPSDWVPFSCWNTCPGEAGGGRRKRAVEGAGHFPTHKVLGVQFFLLNTSLARAVHFPSQHTWGSYSFWNSSPEQVWSRAYIKS
jgi:hypothetical protein